MKVRVLKASLNSYWYADKIGEVFDVEQCKDPDQLDFCYQLKDHLGTRYFNKHDVKTVKEYKQMAFTKDMLKTGMRVVHGKHPRQSDYAIVIKDTNKIEFPGGGWNYLESYDDNLNCSSVWDITEVYAAPERDMLNFNVAGELIWQRNKPKTPEQIQLDAVMDRIAQLQQEANTLKGLIESK